MEKTQYCNKSNSLDLELWNESYPLANSCINELVCMKTKWINEEFIYYFTDKYKHLDISPLDEISLLMYEANKLYEEESIYDIYIHAIQSFSTFHTKIYLLQKTIFYCNNYIYPYKLFSELTTHAHKSSDYRLLADTLSEIFDKYAEHVMDALILDGVEKYLFKAKKLAQNDYENISLAFSFKRHNFIEV